MSQKRFFKLWGRFVNKQLEKENHYLKTELEWVQSHLQKRPKPTPDEKALLARVAHDLNPELLAKTFNFFSPSTLKAWYHRLVAQKWDYSHLRKKAGRPRISLELEQPILRLAKKNPQADYRESGMSFLFPGPKLKTSTPKEGLSGKRGWEFGITTTESHLKPMRTK